MEGLSHCRSGRRGPLTGLVFVAVSINLSQILKVSGLPGRAAESLFQLFGVLMVSSILLIPEQAPNTVGVELLVVGALLWAGPLLLQNTHFKRNPNQPWSWILSRVILGQLATIPFAVAGLSILTGFPGGLYWMAPGFIFSFLAGVLGAWVLLVEILR